MCKKPAKASEVIMVNNQSDRVHAYHFTCQMCRSVLSAKDCKEFDNSWYCGTCFGKISSRVCAGCRRPIVGRSIAALGKLWHPDVKYIAVAVRTAALLSLVALSFR